ncbi:MAG: DUF4126 family protein [Actinomycetota bacterium]|nr:DUF4126 family protein [Actinomycetota bacterium]
MDTVFDILTGAGLGAAAGIRPFLPAMVAGAAASADLFIDFEGTDLSFLEQAGFLLAVVLVLIAFVMAQRRLGSEGLDRGPLGASLAGLALGVGALLFAGALADHSDTWWPGLIGGVLCALLAQVTVRDLLRRTRSRLDPDAREALTVYADGASLVLAALAIVAPPVSAIALAALAWLLFSGRRREGEKYAGLRILR